MDSVDIVVPVCNENITGNVCNEISGREPRESRNAKKKFNSVRTRRKHCSTYSRGSPRTIEKCKIDNCKNCFTIDAATSAAAAATPTSATGGSAADAAATTTLMPNSSSGLQVDPNSQPHSKLQVSQISQVPDVRVATDHTLGLQPATTSATDPTGADNSGTTDSRARIRTRLVMGPDFYTNHPKGSEVTSVLIDINDLKNSVNEGYCIKCMDKGKESKLTIETAKHGSFYHDYRVLCSKCGHLYKVFTETPPQWERKFKHEPRTKTKKTHWRTLAAVYSTMAEGGMSHTALNGILCRLGMKKISKVKFHQVKYHISEVATNAANQNLEENVRKIFAFYADEGIFPDENGILEVDVIYDGTWHTRGHKSLMGAGVIIEARTGLVIDYYTMCNSCTTCTKMKNIKNSQEYEKWYETHKAKCFKNYEDSSGSMEKEGALVMWSRSISKNKMMYTSFIGDGDSSTYGELLKLDPYKTQKKKIDKIECINHVAKRVHKAMMRLSKVEIEYWEKVNPTLLRYKSTKDKKSGGSGRGSSGRGKGVTSGKGQGQSQSKGKGKCTSQGQKEIPENTSEKGEPCKMNEDPNFVKKTKKMGGKNRLTQDKIPHLERWYSCAIRNYDTVEGMQKAIMATFYHLTSTDDHPDHHLCDIKWCFYKQKQQEYEDKIKVWHIELEKLKANPKRSTFYSIEQQCPKPEKPNLSHEANFRISIKFPRHSIEWEKLKKVYEDLSNEELLKRCVKKFTQNPNESFHSRIWSMCPKSKHYTPPVLNFAIAQSVLTYHKGYLHGGLEEILCIPVTEDLWYHRKIKEDQRLQPRKSRRRRKLPLKGKKDNSYSCGAYLNLSNQTYTVESDNESDILDGYTSDPDLMA